MAYKLSERAFGGFNPASADALRTNVSFITNPAAAVAAAFKQDMEEPDPEEGGEDPQPSSEMDLDISSGGSNFQSDLDLTPEDIPDEEVDVQGAFSTARSLIEGQPAPIPRPLPSALSPSQVFLATFAASFGSQLSRNPRMLSDIQTRMAEYDQRRQAIEDQNAVNDLLYNKEKRNAMISLELKATEAELAEAIATNDFKRTVAASKNLERLKGAVEIEKEQIRQSGETARTKLLIKEGNKGPKGETPKRLTANEYLTRLEQIDTADPDKLPEKPSGAGLWWPAKGEDSNKRLGKLQIHATAALTGETPEMQIQALRRLTASLKKEMNIGEKPKKEQAIKFGNALKELGMPEDVVKQELGKLGFNIGTR